MRGALRSPSSRALQGAPWRGRELDCIPCSTVLKRRDQMLQEVGPDWFQQLSWDQMETVNRLQVRNREQVQVARKQNPASDPGPGPRLSRSTPSGPAPR